MFQQVLFSLRLRELEILALISDTEKLFPYYSEEYMTEKMKKSYKKSLDTMKSISMIPYKVIPLVGEDGSIPYLIVNAIFTALGKVFEGVRIIFLLSLFKDLEKS